MATRPKEDFDKSHQVTFCDQSVRVTCRWEAEYLFSLDSKYTNNSLEKAIVRAVHGPWDVSLSESMEEMKLILHMWVALFYSKPFRSPTVRKVVEHSNPAKFVSLNSVLDPLESIDEGEGNYDSEKRSADLFLDAYQTPCNVEGRVCSPVEKPLSCNELSSTNFIEYEAPFADPKKTRDPPLKDEPVSSLTNDLEGLPQADKVPGEEPEEEFLAEPITSVLSQSSSSFDGISCSEAEASKTVDLFEVSQSDSASALPELPETTTDTQGIGRPKPEIDSFLSSAEEKESCQIGSTELLYISGARWLEASAKYGKGERLCKGEGGSQDLPADEVEEDVDGESMEVESIDLALSDSNDADAEPRDVDLCQDNEDLPQGSCAVEETCLCDVASPGDSLTTLVPSPTSSSTLHRASPETVAELPGDPEEKPAELAPNSAFVNPMDSIEGFSVLQGSERERLADLQTPRTVCFHLATLEETTELARIRDSDIPPKHPESPKPADQVECSCISQEDKEPCLEDSVSLQATELNRIKNDSVAQRDSAGSQEDLLVLGKSPTFSNSLDLGGVFKGGKETSQPDSALQSTDPACWSKSVKMPELPGNQEDSVMSTKSPVSPIQTNMTEDESQEKVPLTESVCELGQVQNSLPTEEECVESQNDSLISAKNLQSAKLLGLVGNSCVSPEEEEYVESQSDSLISAKNVPSAKLLDVVEKSCVSQEEKGTHPLDSAPLQNRSAHQTTPARASESPEDQEDSVTSGPNLAFPEQIGLDGGTCTDREDEDMNAADSVPSNTSHQKNQEEQMTRRMSKLLIDAIEGEEIQPLGLAGSESGGTSEVIEPNEKDENNGNISAMEEVANDDKIKQIAATLSEKIKSYCKLIATVSGLKAEREGSYSKEDSGLNWISSMALESVTPPESDEESYTTDQLASSDPGLVVGERLEGQGIFVNQEAESQEDGQCLSTSREGSQRVGWVEKEPSEEKAVSAGVLSSPHYEDRGKSGTPSLDGKFQLAETVTSSKNNDSIVPMLGGEVGLGPAIREASILAREAGRFREGLAEALPCVPGGHLVEYPPEESDSPFHGGTSEGQKWGDREDAMDVQLASERTQFPTSVFTPTANQEVESVSADDDQELSGDPYRRNPSANPCRTRSTNSSGVTGATYICDLRPEEEISKSDEWMFLGGKTRILDAEPEVQRFDRPLTCRRDPAFSETPALLSLKRDGEQGALKDFINFSITMKHKDKTRTFFTSKRGDAFMDESGLINSLSRTWRVLDDPIQSTLDMECLRFHYKLKQILEKKRPQFSTSSDLSIAPQVTAETLPLRKVPEAPALNLPPRSRSPLLITIANPRTRRIATCRWPRMGISDYSFEPPPSPPWDSFSKAARSRSQGQERPAPFHLNKLTYNNKLKDCRGDISVIMDEFAELSRVMKLDDRQTSNKGRDHSTTSEDVPEKRCLSLPRKGPSYDHLFDDLCNSLHFRLTNVAKEACRKPYSFYLVETDNDPFFGRIKTLLKKGGHSEADPQHFCKASHPETDRLVVIIRNEDIFLHIHEIPSLVRLKHLPSVTFAGVDSPEDMMDHTYQELFHSGGFVVSDDQMLETMTTGELKDVIKTLEQLNGHRKWRWLLHYKETKKLRENARADPVAHSKDSILRSCQGASFTEVLHYHRCDSRTAMRAEFLNCLLNLQVQHISARLAIFLTEKPSASREALESKGVLVLDVRTFVATAQDLAASCRSNY